LNKKQQDYYYNVEKININDIIDITNIYHIIFAFQSIIGAAGLKAY